MFEIDKKQTRGSFDITDLYLDGTKERLNSLEREKKVKKTKRVPLRYGKKKEPPTKIA